MSAPSPTTNLALAGHQTREIESASSGSAAPLPQTRDGLLAALPTATVQRITDFAAGNPTAENYVRFVDEIVSAVQSPSDLPVVHALVLSLYGPHLALVTARAVFARLLSAVQTLSDTAFSALAAYILHVHHLPNNTRTFAFESALISLRDRLSSSYEARSDWSAAAEVLTRIPFETLNNLADHGVLRYNLRIASLFIAAHNVDKAEFYLSRTTTQLATGTDPHLALRHRVCHARILELKRRFDDAALRFYSLAHDPHAASLLDPTAMNDAQPALERAVTCAILAPAGPRRARLLAMLHNDDRSRSLDMFPLLDAIHMGRLLRREQVDGFRATLMPTHLAAHADADSVLDRAVLEHNVLAVSRMYANIGLSQMAALLDVSPDVAEQTAAKMIYEKRMSASIDQVEGLVQFANTSSTSKVERWDGHIANVCSAVDDCVDAIVAKYPQFAAHLDV